jgi:splicing factor U2AF 35 kDa subunit
MAAHLARIHGTEEDKVNCPFYFKIGSCRHGDRCSRLHHKPAFSPTLLIQHLYRHPQRLAELHQAATASQNGGNNGMAMIMNPEQAQEDFLTFFEDLYMEFSKFGKLDALHVCDNLGDHMIGTYLYLYIYQTDNNKAMHRVVGLHGWMYETSFLILSFFVSSLVLLLVSTDHNR